MENKNRVVEVKDLPETTLAYVRYGGPYKGDGKLFEGLFGKLFQWAGSRNLLRFPETKTILNFLTKPMLIAVFRSQACLSQLIYSVALPLTYLEMGKRFL